MKRTTFLIACLLSVISTQAMNKTNVSSAASSSQTSAHQSSNQRRNAIDWHIGWDELQRKMAEFDRSKRLERERELESNPPSCWDEIRLLMQVFCCSSK